MITIRRATLEDMSWLLGQLVAFDQFFGSSRSLFPDMTYAEQLVAGLITEHPFFVAELTGEGWIRPVGFIAGMLTPHFFNPCIRVLTELFWWVPVEFRGTRTGALLLSAFLAHGQEHADLIVMTLEVESPVNPAGLLKRGFRAKETSYLLEVPR